MKVTSIDRGTELYLQERINFILASIQDAKKRFGIDYDISIVPATKTISADIVSRLPDFGITAAGENRVQEFLTKYDSVNGIDWHIIGALQTNKVKYVADKVSMIQSLDRVSLADEIDRQCSKISKVMPTLIEINIGGEESKSGVSIAESERLIDYILQKKWIRLDGMMTVMPINADDSLYETAGRLYQDLAQKYSFRYFSMGMSGDYIKAIEYGANMIRPGSVIFGDRVKKQKQE